MVPKFGILVIAALASSATSSPVCSCTRSLRPVCGSDGETYNNECLLKCARETNAELTKASEGRCPDQLPGAGCICTLIYKPVCGVDGKTYSSSCQAGCSSVDVSHDGECQTVSVAQPPCICTDNLSPVCGSDGNTYDNDCLLNCATVNNSRLSIDYSGPCKTEVNIVNNQPECTCPENLSPVCGSDGVSYDNDCLLNCATVNNSRLSIAYSGLCKTDVIVANNQPECSCPEIYSPVCGSDGTTYDNDCLLNCATADNSRLSIAHHGACSVVNQPECKCESDHKPVCGSDGVTYENDCWLNCATQYNSRLSVAYSGFCKDGNDGNAGSSCTCTRNLSPVCGSDGVTYNNECLLRCAGKEKSRDGECEARS